MITCWIFSIFRLYLYFNKIIFFIDISKPNPHNGEKLTHKRTRKMLIYEYKIKTFCSMLLMILQEALLAPITFLYATERRLRSSTVKSELPVATFFMYSTISVRGRIIMVLTTLIILMKIIIGIVLQWQWVAWWNLMAFWLGGIKVFLKWFFFRE